MLKNDLNNLLFHYFSGTVTNVITATAPPGIKSRKYLPHLIIGDFKRVMGIENEEDPLVNITSQKLSLVSIITRLQYNKKNAFQ